MTQDQFDEFVIVIDATGPDELIKMIEMNSPEFAKSWKESEKAGYCDGFGGMECRNAYIRYMEKKCQ